MNDLLAIPLFLAWVGVIWAGLLIPYRAGLGRDGAPWYNVALFAVYLSVWFGVAYVRVGG